MIDIPCVSCGEYVSLPECGECHGDGYGFGCDACGSSGIAPSDEGDQVDADDVVCEDCDRSERIAATADWHGV